MMTLLTLLTPSPVKRVTCARTYAHVTHGTGRTVRSVSGVFSPRVRSGAFPRLSVRQPASNLGGMDALGASRQCHAAHRHLVLVAAAALFPLAAAVPRVALQLVERSISGEEALPHVATAPSGSVSALSTSDGIRCAWSIAAEVSSSQPPSWITSFRIVETSASCGPNPTGNRSASTATMPRPHARTAASAAHLRSADRTPGGGQISTTLQLETVSSTVRVASGNGSGGGVRTGFGVVHRETSGETS